MHQMNNGDGAVLSEILKRLAEIDPEQCTGPTEEPRSGIDHVVAVATPAIKKLYSLRDSTADEANSIFKMCDGEPDNNQTTDLIRLKKMHQVLDALLWAEIDRAHPDLMLNSTGIRKDWQLCWFESEPGPEVHMVAVRIPFPFEVIAAAMGKQS